MRGSEFGFGRVRGFAVLGAALFVLSAMATHAVPVSGKEFSLRQPDGTFVQVRIWGDEYYQIVESLDGYTLVRDPRTQIICYAKPSADRSDIESTGLRVGSKGLLKLGIVPHLRPAQKVIAAEVAAARALAGSGLKTARGEKAAPTTGAVAGICLIVDFSDQPGTISRSAVDNFCNQVGYTGYGNNGSVRDYFSAVSGGQLTYTNYVHHFGTTGYFRAPKPKSYYDDPTAEFGKRAAELVVSALNALAAAIDVASYDKDGDGYVDAVNCLYAGTPSGGWSAGLWPHQSGLTWTGDGVRANAYQISDMGSALTISTFCHENGHLVMNWPDLYDYDFDSTGVGDFCLMGYFGRDDQNPTQPCAPLKIKAGWGTTENLTTQRVGLVSTAGSNIFYRHDNPANPAEYYVFENRQATGRDASLPDSGLAIWHVDENGSNDWNQQLPNQHFMVSLVQADGQWDLEHDRDYGDATDLWGAPGTVHFGPGTNPNSNWWDGTRSDVDISNISAPGASMTFNFNPPSLQVSTLEDFNASGPSGGPFFPASKSYTLSNGGGSPLTWTAVPGQGWLSTNPSGGTLAPGGSVAVLVSMNASAANLVSSLYKTSIAFTNTGTGESTTRSVRLRVGTVDDCTEWFQSLDNDLDNTTITFTPNADGTTYWACRKNAVEFPSNTIGGTALTLEDDDSYSVALSGGRQVYLYGQAYTSLYVGSNGYITFTGPDTRGYNANLDAHFSLPRVAGLFDDLNPAQGGTVTYQQLADRVVVTYAGVPQYNTSNFNSFQIELFFDKTISMTWLGIGNTGGIAGLSAGDGIPFGYVESNFMAYTQCVMPTVSTTLSSIAPDPTRLSPIPVAVSFGEPVTGFTLSDISVLNGTVSGFSGSGASYSFNLTPLSQGPTMAIIAEGVAAGSDGAVNAEASIGRVFDSIPPSVSISAPTPALTAQGPVTYTVTYTGASNVTLDNAHVALIADGANGTANVTGAGMTRTVTVSNVSGNGTVALSILAGSAVDAAGNLAPAAGPGPAFTVDNTVTSINIGPPSVALTRSGPVIYSVRYDNVASVSLVAGNVVLNRTGTANATVSVSAAKAEGTQFRLVALSNITGEGTLGISIAAGTARDAFNSPAPAAGPSATFVVDSVPPVLNLRGSKLMAIEVNTVFIDPGVTAYDNVDGDLSGAVVVDDSNLDTTRLGTYVVRYTVLDAAGNIATELRTVYVGPVGEATLPLATWPTMAAVLGAAWLVQRRRWRAKK